MPDLELPAVPHPIPSWLQSWSIKETGELSTSYNGKSSRLPQDMIVMVSFSPMGIKLMGAEVGVEDSIEIRGKAKSRRD
jgi:hypothetical protein